jgi:hypothetical protein
VFTDGVGNAWHVWMDLSICLNALTVSTFLFLLLIMIISLLKHIILFQIKDPSTTLGVANVGIFVPLVKFNVSGRGGPCKFKLCLESMFPDEETLASSNCVLKVKNS